MLPTFFNGEYELTIDEKNRLLIPSDIRKALVPERDGDAFILNIGKNNKVWIYTELFYKNMTAELEKGLTPDDDDISFNLLYFGMTARIEMDKQGRVLLPEKNLKRAGLGREITMLGVGSHLQLWNRAEWEEYSVVLQQQRAGIESRATAKQKASATATSGLPTGDER